jgi:serine/threonine-protein kinase
MAASDLPERWSRISPLLDELLDLTGSARDQRLACIAIEDPELAEDIARLMALESERAEFLSQPIVETHLFAPQTGQAVGPYRLETPLGEGGMGQVWLAMRADGLYERRVALKLLRPGLGDTGLNARFTRERQILARLAHPHIARLLDAGISQDGQPYLALDYIRGEPITVHASRNRLTIASRLQLFAQVCAAVSHAHANLVVHRDLKPSNILVTPADEVCLLDFGIAKLLDQPDTGESEITQTGSRTFTLHYAAPEQLRGEVITTMTDVYALGVVLYELLTDCRPYELTRASDAAWEEAILSNDPIRPSMALARLAKESREAFDRRRARIVAGDLDNIVLKALDKDPMQRYASVEALAQDLRRFSEGKPVLARPQGVVYRMRKFMRRHALAIGLVAAAIVLLLGSLAVVSWQARNAFEQAARAQAMQDFVIALFENTGDVGGERLDARALLDAGVSRADSELASQPLARAELLGLIARLRSGLGDDNAALDLLDQQQQALRGLGQRAPAALVLESAALRGRSLRDLGRPQACLEAMVPLLDRANQEAAGLPLPASEFFSQLGRCRGQLGDVALARDLFGQALAIRRAHPEAAVLAAESETDLAQLQIDAGQPGPAVSALREALAHLRAASGEANAQGVDIWSQLGLAYDRENNLREAEAAYRQALDISLGRFGAGHPRSSHLQFLLARVLARSGKLSEAGGLLDLAHDALLSRSNPDLSRLAEIDGLRGWLALERDRPADALHELADALAMWRRREPTIAHVRETCWLAQARLASGRDPVGDEGMVACLAGLKTDHSADAMVAFADLVHAALDRNAFDRARAWLETAPPALGNNDAFKLAQARWAVATGSGDAAMPVSALLAQSVDSADSRRLRWQALGLRAVMECRQGLADGPSLRAAVLAEASREEPERTTLQRRLATITAACANSSATRARNRLP